ncbi:polysaccharide lyase family 8 protein [Agrocybe pediades]|nr:polysaccharide lyase family 8 protein [Agrocybe pediades]
MLSCISTLFCSLLFMGKINVSSTVATSSLATSSALASSTSAHPTQSSVVTSSIANITSTSFSATPSSLASTITTANTTSTSATSTTASQPTQTLDPSTLQEIQILQTRRLSSIIGAITTSPKNIPAWLSTLGPDGKWPDSEVDYTTGCDARRANWPAQTHWQRILTMAAAWHGGLKGDDQFVKDPTLHAAISSAMDYWFGRDFTNPACLDSGGTPACPCDNLDNSLWNTNWFSNIILIPEFVGQVCLILNDTLVETQVNNCTHMTGRAYGTFDHSINGVGFLTGANTLDVAKIGIDQALLADNVTMLTDAYGRVHNELLVKNGVKVDGIRADGSFGQHGGMFTNDVVDLEVEAGGTSFAAGPDSQNALATLFDGDKWMIYINTLTGVLHWDFSALGRFISFPVVDNQATGSIHLNLTEIGQLGQQWGSETLINFSNSLSANVSTANAGNLVGNRMFYANDYMVQRGKNYVTTVKMFSSRTQNTECTNSQNPFGFHLSDGTVYTYLVGNEYEDISAAWDWNLIPGITVDYNATVLACGTTQQTGKEVFVGGVSDDTVGIAVMRYTNPLTRSLHWQKAWFFLQDDMQHVMISNISSSTSAPVYTVLDQKLHSGPVVLDGSEGAREMTMSNTAAQSLWHANVGYIFPQYNGSATISLQVGQKTGNWATIGTSTQPPPTVDLFAAWIQHIDTSASISYTMLPGVTQKAFTKKQSSKQLQQLQEIQNDGSISAVLDQANQMAFLVFWEAGGGNVTFTPKAGNAPITVTANANIALIYRLKTGEVTVSDPSQTLTIAQVSLALNGTGGKPPHWGSGNVKSLVFQLPGGGVVGSSVTLNIN